MHKKQLARAIHKETHLGIDKAYEILSSLSNNISDSLKKRESIKISGFGTFDVYFRKKFSSKHPKRDLVDRSIEVPASFVVKFRASNTLKKIVNPALSALWSKNLSNKEFALPKPKIPTVITPTWPNLSKEGKNAAAPEQKVQRPIVPPQVTVTPRPKAQTQTATTPNPQMPNGAAPRANVLSKTPTTQTPPKQKPAAPKKPSLLGATIPKETLRVLPEYLARLYNAVPVKVEGANLTLAMKNPGDLGAIEFIKKKTKMNILPMPASDEEVAGILNQYSGMEMEIEKALKGADFVKHAKKVAEEEEEKIVSEEAPTAKVVQSIITQAVRKSSSDIHIEPTEKEVIIRFRVDGVLQKITTLPKTIHAAIISKIKILSSLKIDETRLPQDGRFKTTVDKKEIDFRVSTFPTIFGEKAVMRILDKSKGILTLEELGLRGRGFKLVEEGIHKSHGMTLVTGPTGSGKTTTLYAVIDRLNNAGQNIVTLEDPVEYQIPGINQAQVKPSIGFSFANGLRSILRQDPDVIMVGEIRDFETAELSIHSALTGHIVLSTLHTNNAAGAIPRLIDMKIEPFLLASAVNTIVAQRLARKICEQCRTVQDLEPGVTQEIEEVIEHMPSVEKDKVKRSKLEFYQGKGCKACSDTGYKGRVGLFEVLSMNAKISELTIAKSSEEQIETEAKSDGMLAMKEDGIMKALEGITTIEEVFRITKD